MKEHSAGQGSAAQRQSTEACHAKGQKRTQRPVAVLQHVVRVFVRQNILLPTTELKSKNDFSNTEYIVRGHHQEPNFRSDKIFQANTIRYKFQANNGQILLLATLLVKHCTFCCFCLIQWICTNAPNQSIPHLPDQRYKLSKLQNLVLGQKSFGWAVLLYALL